MFPYLQQQKVEISQPDFLTLMAEEFPFDNQFTQEIQDQLSSTSKFFFSSSFFFLLSF